MDAWLGATPRLATRSSWLQQPVALGPVTMTGGLVLYVLLCAGVVAALNGLYQRRLQRLMAYLRRHHPDVHARVQPRPDIAGIGYSKGYRRIRPLQELAPRLRELRDPELERQVQAFLRFDRRFLVVATPALAALVVAGLLLGVLLPPA